MGENRACWQNILFLSAGLQIYFKFLCFSKSVSFFVAHSYTSPTSPTRTVFFLNNDLPDRLQRTQREKLLLTSTWLRFIFHSDCGSFRVAKPQAPSPCSQGVNVWLPATGVKDPSLRPGEERGSGRWPAEPVPCSWSFPSSQSRISLLTEMLLSHRQLRPCSCTRVTPLHLVSRTCCRDVEAFIQRLF